MVVALPCAKWVKRSAIFHIYLYLPLHLSRWRKSIDTSSSGCVVTILVRGAFVSLHGVFCFNSMFLLQNVRFLFACTARSMYFWCCSTKAMMAHLIVQLLQYNRLKCQAIQAVFWVLSSCAEYHLHQYKVFPTHAADCCFAFWRLKVHVLMACCLEVCTTLLDQCSCHLAEPAWSQQLRMACASCACQSQLFTEEE